MKTLVFPDGNLYQYRCDGPLCNPDPRKITPKTDYSKMMVSAIYIREEDDKDYDNMQIQGWNYITTRKNIIHICPECTTATINTIRKKIELYISNLPVKKASLQIANLLFDLEVYHD